MSLVVGVFVKMRSNYWVPCGILLLCLASVQCGSDTFDGYKEFSYRKNSEQSILNEAKDGHDGGNMKHLLSRLNKILYADDKADKCKSTCGSKKGVKCIGEPFGAADVSCSCTDEKMSFIEDTKECKPDKCKSTCGSKKGVKCIGDPFGAADVSCSCTDDKMSFKEDTKECKKKCETAQDCGEGATCTDQKICECKDGYGGNNCKDVLGCKDLKPNCIKADATCVYDEHAENKASCMCNNGTLKYDSTVVKCKLPCEDKCENGGDCTGDDVKFCKCKNGTSGDLCQTVTDCEKKEYCGKKTDVNCTFDVEKLKAVCQCKDSSKEFHRTERVCKKPCDSAGCQNGGNCTEEDAPNFCQCDPLTSGDLCEIVQGCEAKKFNNCKGDNGTCVLDLQTKIPKCECNDDKHFDEKVKECREKCEDNDDCENGALCGKNKFCECKKGTYGDLCLLVFDCEEKGKYKTCKSEEGKGTCAFDVSQGFATCTCDEPKTLDITAGHCRAACKGDDCKNTAVCTAGFCKCKAGTSGDTCEIVDDCSPEKKLCGEKDDVKCGYSKTKFAAECTCTDDKKIFDDNSKICRKKCQDNSVCGEKEACTDGMCKCAEGYEGEDCSVVTGCKEMDKVCKAADAICIHDTKATNRATCNCTHEDYEFDGKHKCEPKWCKDDQCGKEATCEFDKETKVGTCKCKEEDKEKYFDYNTRKCIEPDKCVLKKTACGDDRICENGECKCKKNYGDKYKNGTCVFTACESNPCITGAECLQDGDTFKCTCPAGKVFSGKKTCLELKCVSKDFKKTCEDCPIGMTRKEGNCASNDEKLKPCSEDCGYGYCLKEEKKDSTCKCIESIAKNVKGKCVLKAQVVCASQKLTEDSTKCDCTGKYRLADDGITCALKTCSDKEVQDECESKGAKCVMIGKKDTVQYHCGCPKGYSMDEDRKICTDVCSTEREIIGCLKTGQFCYNSVSDSNDETGDCRCPPPLKFESGACSDIAENVYAIRNIPVLKKEYVVGDNVDYVLLNADLIRSMKQTFANFDYGYLQEFTIDKNILNCSVWVQFTSAPSSEIKRIFQQTRTFNCTDCDSNLKVWPPRVLLSGEHMKEIKEVNLEFCSDDTKNRLCGKEALCSKNACSCPKGYKTLEYSIREEKNKFRIQRCEDINECAAGSNVCSANTTCVNIPGDYYCKCLPKYRKNKDPVFSQRIQDKEPCFDMCTPNPCAKGSCNIKSDGFDCSCSPGYGGALCDREDANFASAKKSLVTVGAILGTILAVTIIAFALFYRRVRKNSYSEDFAPAPRMDHAEMMERRPMRGVVNKSYE